MEVLCEKCQTEYDFDDALVSERGTTVKCTNCGHQFRVYRPEASQPAPERWCVRTSDGRDHIFTSLRDLQRALTRGIVGRCDTLVREGTPPRRLAEIAELEPFFPSLPPPPASVPPARPVMNTVPGMGTWKPPQQGQLPSVRPEPGKSDTDFDEATMPRMESDYADEATVPRLEGSSLADLLEKQAALESKARSREITLRPPAVPPPAEELDMPTVREKGSAALTPTPSEVKAAYGSRESMTNPQFVSVAPPKRSTPARWIIALLIVGAVAAAGATVGRPYVTALWRPATSATAQDPRVSQLLEQGERSLLDGDIDAAKAAFDKASLLDEHNPRVMQQLARLANVRADVAWLRLRLIPADRPEARELAQRELSMRLTDATALSQKADRSSSGDVSAARIRLDALRLAGDLEAARKLVPRVSGRATDPEVAYVLAALEMSEATPNWSIVIERLRLAAASEQSLGRARGALVFALATSGQTQAAQSEYDVLAAAPRPYPLLMELHAFLTRLRAQAGDSSAEAAADAGTEAAVAQPAAAGAVEQGQGAVALGGYQERLKAAHEARRAGNLARAEELYRSILAENPGDTEALTGLGDVAKARGDRSASVDYYEQVSKQNPGYLPAMMGLADAKWEAGDRAGAVALYQQVIDRVGGQGSYADRAKQRVAQAQNASASPAPSASSTQSQPSAPPSTPTEAEKPSPKEPEEPSPGPHIDTTDLPDFNR